MLSRPTPRAPAVPSRDGSGATAAARALRQLGRPEQVERKHGWPRLAGHKRDLPSCERVADLTHEVRGRAAREIVIIDRIGRS